MPLQYLKKYYRDRSAKLLFSLFFFIVAIFIFAVITDEIILEKEENIDLFVFHFFEKYVIKDSLTGFMFAITQFSSATFIKLSYPFLVVLLILVKMYRKAIFIFTAGVGGLLLIYGMKIFFMRPRPPYPLVYKEESFSFPSGHATFGFIFYGTLAYFIWLSTLPKIWKYITMTFLITLSLTIGFSRVYLRVHFPSDVLGGFCLGYSWLFLMIYAFRKWYPVN